MDTIKCTGCNRNIVPRLISYSPIFGGLRYKKTNHNCAFCGSTLYVSGGELNIAGKLVGLLVLTYVARIRWDWLKEFGPLGYIGSLIAPTFFFIVLLLFIAGFFFGGMKSVVFRLKNLIKRKNKL